MAREISGNHVKKSKKQLINEIETLNERVAELERAVTGSSRIEEALLNRELVKPAAM